jgi:hypothetical protein
MTFLRTALFLLTATAALAEDAPLATLTATSGSLPPPHAWSVAITIGANGLVTAQRCKGYETEGPACKTATATATPEALEAIRKAAKASGLATHPAKPLDPPMVGGGTIRGTVLLDGQTIEMIPQPVPEDAERVNTLIDIVGAAVPRELDALLSGE